MLVTQPSHRLAEIAGAASKGGVTMIQIRDKQATDAQLVEQAIAVKSASGDRATIIVNGSIAAAKAAGADGVQLPEHAWRASGSIALAKSFGLIVGASVHEPGDAVLAEELGADYLVAGTIFESLSHIGAPGAGLAHLSNVCAAVSIPVIAIGGITPENLLDCTARGALGIAVLSPIMQSDAPEAVARTYSKKLASWRIGEKMVESTINGKNRQTPEGQTVQEFIASLGRDPRMVVVEYNGTILKRDQYAVTEIKSGDVLEIVQMMAGG